MFSTLFIHSFLHSLTHPSKFMLSFILMFKYGYASLLAEIAVRYFQPLLHASPSFGVGGIYLEHEGHQIVANQQSFLSWLPRSFQKVVSLLKILSSVLIGSNIPHLPVTWGSQLVHSGLGDKEYNKLPFLVWLTRHLILSYVVRQQLYFFSSACHCLWVSP